MGKSEILMLLAGVALSIMLAMIAIPMFSSGSEMADRQQVQQELLAIKSAIPLIKALEGSGDNKINNVNIQRHIEGFKIADVPADGIQSDKKKLATFNITDDFKEADATPKKTITVIIKSMDGSSVKLNKLSRLDDICDKGINTLNSFAPNTDEKNLTCIMSR